MKTRTEQYPATFISWRFYFVLSVILLIVVGLVVRLVDLTVFKSHFLQRQGNARALRVIQTPAFRGMVTDRVGHPLAISTAVFSIWINPQEFIISKATVKPLANVLKIKSHELQLQLTRYKNKHREFMYIKRDVSPEIAGEIKELRLAGVYQQQDYKRFYPEGETTAHVVGFTNVDDKGQEGLELLYNRWLSGVPGKSIVYKDRLGRVISEIQMVQEQKAGQPLVLSIDHRLQYLAYRELMEGVKRALAHSGSAVVLDIKTGEVLAMVNYPSYNPNNRVIKDTEVLRNRAVTDVYEPGSTIKAFSVATALDSGHFTPDSVINTYPGWLVVGHHLVRDEHSKGPMSVAQILQISSNVGVTKMILTLPPDYLWNFLHRMGFGEESGVDFPGERSGSLVKRDKWSPFALATLAFGYGISVTTLQLAHAYGIIANDGIKLPLTLLKREEYPKGERVMSSKLSKEMMALLESVVMNGTGRSAKIPGYRVVGKTGTSRMIGQHGYEKRYISSFVGMAPATQPRLVVAVVIHDPRGKLYYGADISAPVFKNIMEGGLRMMNVEPDDLERSSGLPH